MLEILQLVASLILMARQLLTRGKSDVADQVLATVGAVVEGSAVSVETLREIEAAVEAMVAEDREPTPEEWTLLRSRSDALHDAIQDVDLRGDG